MAGFTKRGSLSGENKQAVLHGSNTIIANSQTIQVGDAVYRDTDGFIIVAAAGTRVLGICVGVTDKDGIRVDPDSPTTPDTYTVESDNETDKQWKAMIETSKDVLWLNDADEDLERADDELFYNLADENTIDGTAAAAGQFALIKRDPLGDGDLSLGLFVIAESQLDPYAQV